MQVLSLGLNWSCILSSSVHPIVSKLNRNDSATQIGMAGGLISVVHLVHRWARWSAPALMIWHLVDRLCSPMGLPSSKFRLMAEMFDSPMPVGCRVVRIWPPRDASSLRKYFQK